MWSSGPAYHTIALRLPDYRQWGRRIKAKAAGLRVSEELLLR